MFLISQASQSRTARAERGGIRAESDGKFRIPQLVERFDSARDRFTANVKVPREVCVVYGQSVVRQASDGKRVPMRSALSLPVMI